MKTINNTTKTAQRFVNAYNRSTASTLADVYGRYSTEKSRAEYFCRQRMQNENGDGFRIISYNTFGFSCGWQTADGLRVETACNSYLIKN